MAKETVEKEVEEVNKYIKEETYWTCDDCQREFDEEELVPVAVAPESEEIGHRALTHEVENRLYQASYLKAQFEKSQATFGTTSRESVELQKRLRRGCEDVARELLKEVEDGRGYGAASVLDVCPECLEDDFGITVEEHGGRLFEERNFEQPVKKMGVPEGQEVGLMVFFFCCLALIYTLADVGVGGWGALLVIIILSGFLYGFLRSL